MRSCWATPFVSHHVLLWSGAKSTIDWAHWLSKWRQEATSAWSLMSSQDSSLLSMTSIKPKCNVMERNGIKDKSRHLRHPICLPCSLLWRHQSVSCASLFRSHCHLCLLSKHPSALWRTPGPVRSWQVTARKNFKELLLMYRDFNPTVATGSWDRMRALCRMLWNFWSTLCYMQSCPPILLSTILPS